MLRIFIVDKNSSEVKMSSNFLTVNQRTCPGSITYTQTTCETIPNAVWIPQQGASDPTVQGECICCSLDGTAYVNSTATSSANACLSCGSNPACGSQGGYCGSNTNPNCTQNSTTGQWSIQCSAGTTCGNGCTGNCGIGEYFLFQTCQESNGTYSCSFSFSQWKSWVVWGIILLIILGIILLFVHLSNVNKEKKTEVTHIVATPTPGSGTVVTTQTTQAGNIPTRGSTQGIAGQSS